jgi:putative transposase
VPPNLKRIYGDDDLHFLTFSCYQRAPLLGTPNARNAFVSSLSKVRHFYDFLLLGYVVMPEHVHLLVSESKQTPSYLVSLLKKYVSADLGKGGTQTAPFWQHRFYDFNVFTTHRLWQKLSYMHMNPVVRGLVEHPSDWPWSSFVNYQDKRDGLIPIDFP